MQETPPNALLIHRTPGRIRIGVPSRKGDRAYFSGVQTALASVPGVERLSVNPLTGTVLASGGTLDVDLLASAAAEGGLFVLQAAPKPRVPAYRPLLAPVESLDRSLRRLTGGEIDLAVAMFLSLIGFGLWELARGNFKTPPWYTAFWYAFGVLTKTLIDRDRAE